MLVIDVEELDSYSCEYPLWHRTQSDVTNTYENTPFVTLSSRICWASALVFKPTDYKNTIDFRMSTVWSLPWTPIFVSLKHQKMAEAIKKPYVHKIETAVLFKSMQLE